VGKVGKTGVSTDRTERATESPRHEGT